MAAGIDRARLQGTILSSKSISVNVYGAGTFDGWMGLGYSEKRERKVVQGSRKDLSPIGLTAGVYVPGAFSLKFVEATAQMIKEGIAKLDPNGTSYGDPLFALSFQIDEPDAAGPLIQYTFASVALVEPKMSAESNSSDELVEEMGFVYLRSNQNGLTLFSSNT